MLYVAFSHCLTFIHFSNLEGTLSNSTSFSFTHICTHAHTHTYTNTLTRSFSVLLAVSYLSSEIFRPLFCQKRLPLNGPPTNFAIFTLKHCWQSKKWDYIKTHTMQMLSCMYARLVLKTEEEEPPGSNTLIALT